MPGYIMTDKEKENKKRVFEQTYNTEKEAMYAAYIAGLQYGLRLGGTISENKKQKQGESNVG